MFCYQCVMAAENGCGSDGAEIGMCKKTDTMDRLQDIVIFGLKGIAAYRYLANTLGADCKEVDDISQEALYFTLTNVNFNKQDHIRMLMKVGSATNRIMSILDEAHTQTFGIPSPVLVSQNKAEGRAILMSGHDLLAMKHLLSQSEGKGINVYTHSEMLPAHGYPELRKFTHLKGNIGGSWIDQSSLFDRFPGPVVVNTNCIVPLKKSSRNADRLFGSGNVAVEGAKRVVNYDFSEIIDMARQLPSVRMESDATVTTGHSWRAILDENSGILAAANAGRIKRFFVVAGCDAPGQGGEYYRDLAMRLLQDCVLITSSCGKYRFNDHPFGNIPETGIPRYLDLGQCNDSGGVLKIITALSQSLQCHINEVPVTIVLSWMEQKAVAILLGLLNLDIRDIWLGPKPPVFGNLEVYNMFLDDFHMNLTYKADEDLQRMLG